MWSSGLGSWGLGPDRIRQLKDAADFTIYTPGSSAGVPLNIVGSMRAPTSGADIETMRDEIEAIWRDPEQQRAATWTEHQDINEVMLATSLAPDGFLVLLPPDD